MYASYDEDPDNPSQYDMADESGADTYDHILDGIDWQILSEYIPDVSCSPVARDTAYVFLESMRELIEGYPQAAGAKTVFASMLMELVRSKLPIKIDRGRMEDVRLIVRQAYRWYAEDYLDRRPRA